MTIRSARGDTTSYFMMWSAFNDVEHHILCDVEHYLLDEVVDHLMLLSTGYSKLLDDGKRYSLNNVEH